MAFEYPQQRFPLENKKTIFNTKLLSRRVCQEYVIYAEQIK